MLPFLLINIIIALTSYLSVTYVEKQTKKRLRKDSSMVVQKSVFDIILNLCKLVTCLIPILNLKIIYNSIFYKEEMSEELISIYLSLDLVTKVEDSVSQDSKESDIIIPTDYEIIEDEIPSRAIMDILAKSLRPVPPETEGLFIDLILQDANLQKIEVPVPPIEGIDISSEPNFEDMSIDDKIEFLKSQRKTIIEGTGIIIDVEPEELKATESLDGKEDDQGGKRTSL